MGETRDGCHSRPRAISEYLVEAMAGAGAEQICMVIASEKQDLVRFYGSGERHHVSIGYLYQAQPTGMADAIDVAYPLARDATVLMGMPDTIVQPADSLSRIRTHLEDEHCDIALAVAPTDEPGRLGPVNLDRSGRVLEVLDKPASPPHNMVWTVACWAPRFTEFLHRQLAQQPRAHPEAPLGLIFQDAILAGFDVRALPFADGCYIDAGTVDGLSAARRLMSSRTSARG